VAISSCSLGICSLLETARRSLFEIFYLGLFWKVVSWTFFPRPSNSSFPYYLTNYTDSNFEWGARIMKKKLILVNLSKKTRKATTKTAPASAAYARLFIGNTFNFSHHKQRRIYQFIITWNTRNIPVNPRSLTILNYMKQIEGRGRLTEGVQYYFINIVNLKKKTNWKVISLFSYEFSFLYLYLPWKKKCKCNGVMRANVGFFRANVMVMRANVMHCFEQCKW
jgi:hypothetical protein